MLAACSEMMNLTIWSSAAPYSGGVSRSMNAVVSVLTLFSAELIITLNLCGLILPELSYITSLKSCWVPALLSFKIFLVTNGYASITSLYFGLTPRAIPSKIAMALASKAI